MKNGLRNLCFAVWTVLGLVLIAHYIGKPAEAQGQGELIVGFVADTATGDCGTHEVITSTGDVYMRRMGPMGICGPLVPLGNIWGGAGPTAVTPSTWSEIKAKFAPKAGGGN